MPGEPLPPDGGWGWAVVAGSFLVHVITDGFIYTSGVLVNEVRKYYGASRNEMGWLASTLIAVTFGSSPITGFLINKYGCRTVGIVGGLLSSVGLIISFFTPSFNFLYFSLGVVTAFGLGQSFMPSVVVVNQYFEKRRSFAIGLSVCGSGVGTFVMPTLVRYLLDQYGWRGTLLIVAGMMLNCCPFSCAFRPLPLSTAEEESTATGNAIYKPGSTKPESQTECLVKDEEAMNQLDSSVLEEKNNCRNKHVDGDRIDHLHPQVDSIDELNRYVCSADSLDKHLDDGISAHLNCRIPSSDWSKQSQDSYDPHWTYDVTLAPSYDVTHTPSYDTTLDPERDSLPAGGAGGTSTAEGVAGVDVSSGAEVSGPSTCPQGDIDAVDPSSLPVTSSRQPSLSSSLNALAADAPSNPHSMYTSLDTLDTMDTSDLNQTAFSRVCPFKPPQCCSSKMWSNKMLLLIMVANFFAAFSYNVPFIFLPDFAEVGGVDRNRSALLISVIGILSTVSRVLLGWLGDKPCINRLYMFQTAVVVMGVSIMMFPVSTSYIYLVACATVFGVCQAICVALTSVVLVDLFGLKMVATIYGIFLFFSGLGFVVGPPLAGFLFDLTGSYSISFVSMGALMVAGGLAILPIPLLPEYKDRQRERENERMAASQTPNQTDSQGVSAR